MISIFRRQGQSIEQAGCGFLNKKEIDAIVSRELSSVRQTAFSSHQSGGCAPCSLLAADLQVFGDVDSRGVLENERREFAASASIVKAQLRCALETMDEERKAAPAFKFNWNAMVSLATAALLAVVFIVPSMIDQGAGNILNLPGGTTYTVSAMDYTPPTVRNGHAKVWNEAAAAYQAGFYGQAVRMFASIETSGEFADNEVRLHQAALLRGNSLLMLGRHDEAVEVLTVALERAHNQNFAGILDTFYLGLAALGAEDLELATESLQQVADNGGIFADEAQDLLEQLSAE